MGLLHLLGKIAPVLVLVSTLYADTPAEHLLKKSDDWYRSDAGQTTVKNVLSWQTKHGDWPKNTDTTSRPFPDNAKHPTGTFDNGATTGELRVLSRAYRVTGDERCKQAFLRGFDHILTAQYGNGGWPQYYPLSRNYHRHITFNDGAMIRLLNFLRDIALKTDDQCLDPKRRAAAKNAFDHGVECILNCQIVVDGKRTVWCAQHHAETLVPVKARSYEHASLSGGESAGILTFLMSLDEPSPEVIQAVHAGVSWYESAKIEGVRYRKSKTKPALTPDPNAPPLWARFYEIRSNRPIFSDRDGVIKYDIEEIGNERRGGYTWYGNWGNGVFKRYANWPHR
ncbi:pectate lyase [Thalassoroseus pseudoceratinae]|uniref:pectate lyase n=1 Tax=Thalassoroseus pseudoceratinae TaxID=2713176 RepID=UPI001981ABD6|nr:pectate lyase [Thalassoroseus pseudoceratinae]